MTVGLAQAACQSVTTGCVRLDPSLPLPLRSSKLTVSLYRSPLIPSASLSLAAAKPVAQLGPPQIAPSAAALSQYVVTRTKLIGKCGTL